MLLIFTASLERNSNTKFAWLAKQQLDNLSCLGVSHFALERADYDFNDGLVLGRGHGGTAIYWSKNLKASYFSNCDGSIMVMVMVYCFI